MNIMHNYFTDLSTATPSSPTPSVSPPSGVSGGAIAGAVIGGSIVIILAVLAAVAVIVFVIYRKGLCLLCEAQVAICYCLQLMTISVSVMYSVKMLAVRLLVSIVGRSNLYLYQQELILRLVTSTVNE